MGYVDFSYSIFGGVARGLKPYFTDIKDDMQHAKMRYTLEEYLSVALFTTVLTFVLEAMIISFIFGLFVEPLLAVTAALVLSVALSGSLFFFFYAYPATTAKRRENKINKVLPFAVSYLAALSSSKIKPADLFKTMGKFREYGELAEEARTISSNIEIFGMTAYAAIRKQAKSTPSREFRDLLWSMSTMTTSGGDLTSYLKLKGQELMNDHRRRIRKFSQDLSLYVEIYLTLIITGSIFFIVLSSVIATLSAGLETVVVQTFIVFILLPLLSAGFLILIKSLSPLE